MIQYAAAGAKSEAPKVTNNPTTPTWSVAMSRPVAAARPAVGQLLLSSFHRNLSPTKLVTGGGQVNTCLSLVNTDLMLSSHWPILIT